ncbi:MAG: hypothetical protein ACI80V_003836 [Rhodothermales bacterium]|jgi:hypothetical protein
MSLRYLPIVVLLLGSSAGPVRAQWAGTGVGTCEPSSAETILHGNNVKARILNNGGLFWNSGPGVYEVPAGSGLSPLFAASLWIGGRVNGELRVAGSEYGPWEFWSGTVGQATDGGDCKDADRIYRVAPRDIRALDQGLPPSAGVLSWPWEIGAPVVDGDGVFDNYDLANGDRPAIYGNETVYWVMNDVGNAHRRFDTAPLGLEVHGLAFAAASDDPVIDNATFYHYRFINRDTVAIKDA